MDLLYVSTNYFSALGVDPAYGRTFVPDEERYGAEPVVVLSYRTWQQLGGDPRMVGRYVDINARPCRIVGVAPKGFTGTATAGPDIWLPLGACGLVDHYDEERPTGRVRQIWDYPAVQLLGRLKPGLDRVAAEAQLQALVPRLKEMEAWRWRDDAELYLAGLARTSTGEDTYGEKKALSILSTVLMGISGAILLIACLNLANMITIHGATRQREIAIRMAIGGQRLRVVQQLLIESLLLALLGGLLAFVPAFWGIRILSAWLATSPIPVQWTGSFDLRVLGATLGFCLLATVLFGLKPALNLSKRDVIGDLKESGGTVRSTRKRWRLVPRGLSVACQIALSVALVMIAALFAHTAVKTAQADPGFDLANKIVVRIDPLAGGYTHAQATTACKTLAERLKPMPGIEAVGLSTSFPVGDTNAGLSSQVVSYEPGAEDDPARNLVPKAAMVYEVDSGYFDAMGISLLQGQPFSRLDAAPDAEQVVIVDEYLARRLRPDGGVVGSLMEHGWEREMGLYRVVGVVRSLRALSGEVSEWPHLYQPLRDEHVPVYIHLRTTPGAETALLKSVGDQIRHIDSRLPVLSVTSLVDQHRNSSTIGKIKIAAKLAMMFGAMALFLAGLGVYAVRGHMVTSRTGEIGIRMALGATRRDILTLVFRQSAIATLVGLSLGVLLAVALASLIRGGLYGISPLDPASIAVTVVLLAATSVLAGYVPARRAVKIDPMEALRYE
jgi:predicted permease